MEAIAEVDGAGRVPGGPHNPSPQHRPLLLGLVLVAAGAAMVATWALAFRSRANGFDGSSLARNLTRQYSTVGHLVVVRCPAHEPLRSSARFTCFASASDGDRRLTVTESGTKGMVIVTGMTPVSAPPQSRPTA